MTMTTTPPTTPTYDRIKKLLGRARDTSSPLEADIARELAERMMAAAGISEADVDITGDVDPLATFGFCEEPIGRSWAMTIANAVAAVVGCYAHRMIGSRNGKRTNSIRFVGTERQRDTARQLFTWVTEQIDRCATQAKRSAHTLAPNHVRQWLNSYREGMAHEIGNQATRLAETRKVSVVAAGVSTALARTSAIEMAVDKYKADHGIKRSIRRFHVNDGAYTAGKSDGRSVRLQRDVAGAGRLRLGSG
jgi:hypothetical protein